MKHKDLTKQKFGQLTVIKRSQKTNAKCQAHWICKCECGRFLIVRGDTLERGTTTKCSICHGAGRRSKFVKEGDEHGWVI
jgi:hypothetical protein